MRKNRINSLTRLLELRPKGKLLSDSGNRDYERGGRYRRDGGTKHMEGL